MKYPQLNSLVPNGEHFDESAINEGVYLSVAHVDAIEITLTKHAASIEAAGANAEELVTAKSAIATLEGTVEGLQAAAVKDAETITSLQEQVAELGKNASGSGTALIVDKDEVQEEKTSGGLPRYDSPDHPGNQAAKRFGIKK